MKIHLFHRKNEKGQALPEYVVGVLVLMLAFFTPVPQFENKTAAVFLYESFQKNYQGYEFIMSQPNDQ